jgi:hypothetical protein
LTRHASLPPSMSEPRDGNGNLPGFHQQFPKSRDPDLIEHNSLFSPETPFGSKRGQMWELGQMRPSRK